MEHSNPHYSISFLKSISSCRAPKEQNCAWKHHGSIGQPETTKALRHSFATAEDGACVLSVNEVPGKPGKSHFFCALYCSYSTASLYFIVGRSSGGGRGQKNSKQLQLCSPTSPRHRPWRGKAPSSSTTGIFKPPLPLYLPANHPMFGWDTQSSQCSSLVPATVALSPQARHLSLQNMDEQGQSHLPRSSWLLKHQQRDPKTQDFCCFSRICDPCPQCSRHSLDHLARSCPEWKLRSSVVELVHHFLPREVSPGPKP